MGGKNNLLDILSSAAGEYLSLKTDDFKARIVSGLSIGFSRTLSIFVMSMLLMIVLAIFAFGFVMLLGDAIGSWSTAAFIIGGVYLVVFIVIFCLRKKLFINMFINIFSGFSEAPAESDGLKSISLTLVRYLRNRLET